MENIKLSKLFERFWQLIFINWLNVDKILMLNSNLTTLNNSKLKINFNKMKHLINNLT